MALAPFFERAVTAVAGHLSASRESLARTLTDVTVGVRVEGVDPSTQCSAELTINLLARFYPRIALFGSAEPFDALKELARAINPDIEVVSDASPPELTIVVGPVAPDADQRLIHANARGWTASVGSPRDIAAPAPFNPYSASAAACLAVSQLFRRVFGLVDATPLQTRSVCLLDFRDCPDDGTELAPVDLGEVAFIGLGAVGQAALWVLSRHEKLSGRAVLIDDERLELSNLQRYVSASFADVGAAKTAIASRTLATTQILASEHPKTLSEFADAYPEGTPFPTACVSVDNIEARRATQTLLPRLVLNAYTGEGSVGASWHRFADERACLACLYHPRGQVRSHAENVADALGVNAQRTATLLAAGGALSADELAAAARHLKVDLSVLDTWRGKPLSQLYVEVVCGGTALPIPGRGQSEMVPLAHQSVLAGVLLAVGLIKRLSPELQSKSETETLVAWHDVRKQIPRRWAEPRLPVPGCFCGDADYRTAYAGKWPEPAA